ncbi:peptidase M15 [Pseudoalteromonas sp. A25]|uniref:M15 family metallopeptidase n=1 Tax=Pseudoalteromonas sp. A25 TaxID=116092 RepID=UPI0012604353|nr:M15 family metallopeptidase [Pseudoalteromonas sp. A25]BBN81370.1 peptidase M15 [Pseudoalteromonas sp. A25]
MDYSQVACGLSKSHLTDWYSHGVHTDVVSDLTALAFAAKKAGFDFCIASAHRDFARQATIWNTKFVAERPVYDLQGNKVELTQLNDIQRCEAIMLFSALPGASRHHFGSDFDVYAKNCLPPSQSLQLEPWEYQIGGPFAEFNQWLDEHLTDYGFFKPYAHFQGGVAQEPWHISHRLVATQLEQHQTIENITAALVANDVSGKQTILNHLPSLYKRFITNITVPL